MRTSASTAASSTDRVGGARLPAVSPGPEFRMPAEWDRHEATWLGWPHKRSDWPGRFAPIPWVYGEIVRKIAPGETVRILVDSESHEKSARKVLDKFTAEHPMSEEGWRLAAQLEWKLNDRPRGMEILYAGLKRLPVSGS